jgi:hypothetical protein
MARSVLDERHTGNKQENKKTEQQSEDNQQCDAMAR